MSTLDTRLNTRSEAFRHNAARMEASVADLREQVARVALGGDEAARTKHTARGKLLPLPFEPQLERPRRRLGDPLTRERRQLAGQAVGLRGLDVERHSSSLPAEGECSVGRPRRTAVRGPGEAHPGE